MIRPVPSPTSTILSRSERHEVVLLVDTAVATLIDCGKNPDAILLSLELLRFLGRENPTHQSAIALLEIAIGAST